MKVYLTHIQFPWSEHPCNFLALYKGEMCKVLMINFQSKIMGLRVKDRNTLRVGDDEVYTQVIVRFDEIDLIEAID